MLGEVERKGTERTRGAQRWLVSGNTTGDAPFPFTKGKGLKVRGCFWETYPGTLKRGEKGGGRSPPELGSF